jgi:hypothetical protein
MKLINKVKIIIIILIAVTIIFAILGAFNLYPIHEGLEDVPKCSSSLNDDDNDSDYWALKSQIIPPVCPTCPYYDFKTSTSNASSSNGSSSNGSSSNGSFLNGLTGLNIGNKDSNDGSNRDNINDNSILNKVTDNSQQNKTQINDTVTNTDINQQSSQSQNINQDNSVNQDMSQIDSKTEESKFNNLLGNNSIMFGSFGGGGQNSQTANNNGSTNGGSLGVSTPAPAGSTNSAPYAQGPDNTTLGMINDLKGSISKLNQQKPDDKKEQCPPCPACERCPEPAFECKKVPNYRSPSIDNYMPVPVLNDFSRF